MASRAECRHTRGNNDRGGEGGLPHPRQQMRWWRGQPATSVAFRRRCRLSGFTRCNTDSRAECRNTRFGEAPGQQRAAWPDAGDV